MKSRYFKMCFADNSDFLEKQIDNFNQRFINTHTQKICLSLKDSKETILAGLTAEVYGNVFYIKYLWASEKVRGEGLGRKLLKLAEAQARESYCDVIAVDTFSFQAPDFYVSNGFCIVGVLECGDSYNRYYLGKSLMRVSSLTA
ncbi:GNAT family N-acetyltransferase [Shigella sonnei]|nr:GNAT family N-acetyltransferase [Shigella sonnei]